MMNWQSAIHPAIRTYVQEKRAARGTAIDKNADITSKEYEKDFEGILSAALIATKVTKPEDGREDSHESRRRL